MPERCDNTDTAALVSRIFDLNDFSGRELLGDNVVVMYSKKLELRYDFFEHPAVLLAM